MLFFSGSEVIEVAVQIERNGLSFYRSVAALMEQEDIKQLFNHLADEEEAHIKSFESLLEAFREYKPDIPDEEEYYEYIRMLAGMNVFTKKEDIDDVVGHIKNKKDALEVAIKFEKDTIVFFAEIKGLVKESQRDAVEELMREERGHLRKLFRKLKDDGDKKGA